MKVVITGMIRILTDNSDNTAKQKWKSITDDYKALIAPAALTHYTADCPHLYEC